MSFIQPQRPRATASARLVTADVRTPTRTGQHVVNDDLCLSGGRGGRPPGGGPPRRKRAGEPVRKAHRTPQGRRGVRYSRRGVEDPHRRTKTGLCPCWRGGGSPHGGGSGPAGFYPDQGAPVVAGSLWRLPSPQRQDAPDRGSPGKYHMEKSLEEASCTIR